MQTDLILRRLTSLRAADLLPLLAAEGATLIRHESPELTSRAVRLDLVLNVRSATGIEYLHLIEWQGYTKPTLLWRTMRYLAEIREQHQTQPILCTIVYLTPDDDVGDTIVQHIAGSRGAWSMQIDTLRLWELDAPQYAASAAPGLAVLSPVMRGANVDTVFQVAQRVIAETAAEEQGELLGILSVFAEPYIEPAQFLELVGKERVMTSGVIGLLVKEQVEEQMARIEQEREKQTARYEQEKAEHDVQLRQLQLQLAEQAKQTAAKQAERDRLIIVELHHRSIEDLLVARFPTIPLSATRSLHQITSIEQLEALRTAILAAPDQAAAITLIATSVTT